MFSYTYLLIHYFFPYFTILFTISYLLIHYSLFSYKKFLISRIIYMLYLEKGPGTRTRTAIPGLFELSVPDPVFLNSTTLTRTRYFRNLLPGPGSGNFEGSHN